MLFVRSAITYTTVPVTVVGLLFPSHSNYPGDHGYFGQNFLQRDFADILDLPSFISERGMVCPYFVSLR